MDSPFKPQIKLKEMSAEVRSYIHQSIQEFAPFTTPETVVTVLSKDPLQLVSQDEDALGALSERHLKKMFRIAISLNEGGTILENEGLSDNLFEAIKEAKDKLLKQLTEMQDEVISNSDRNVQIRHALTGTGVH